MYKLLHIHNNITFAWDSNKFLNENFYNELVFIGDSSEGIIRKLNELPIKYKVFNEKEIKLIIRYANEFDAVFFYNLDEIKIPILLKIKPQIKAFARFFGYELYAVNAEKYLSESTWQFYAPVNKSLLSFVKAECLLILRKLKILLNIEYKVQFDNQKSVYKRLDAILMISKTEYEELSTSFYLPRLIEMRFTNHENESHHFNPDKIKSNSIIIGNSGHRWNNHLDVLNALCDLKNPFNIEFKLFFNYGTESLYSKTVKLKTRQIKNLHLVENFLNFEEFERIYQNSSALVINSYRQHALGNIITAIKCGCKIYLNKRSSTYHWLISMGFIISEISELTNDIEKGNVKLSEEEQQQNFDCFIKELQNYTIKDFISQVLTVLK